jgi:hypothetical protein
MTTPLKRRECEEAMRNLIRITAVVAALSMSTSAFAAQRTRSDGGGGRLTQMCETGSREIAGLPVDQYRRALQASDAQRAALDDFAKATLKAAQDIKAACPTEAALTAPGRLAAMQMRTETMIAAVATVRPPLEELYALLSNEQKEQIIGLGRKERQGRTGGLLQQDCGSARSSVTEWPTAGIERSVRPTEAQRASLMALQDAAAKAAEMSRGSCPAENLLTPTARLAAVGERLNTLLQAVNTMSAPLNDFYAMLDEEQKSRFNGVSLQQTSQVEQPKAKSTNIHRHHSVGIVYLIRRLIHGF